VSGRVLPPRARRPRATPAQYRFLRYWAECGVEQANRWLATHGPAPQLNTRSTNVVMTRDWAFPVPPVWVVTDAGRLAAGLSPVHRDQLCPACGSVPGERCVSPEGYQERVHLARNPIPAGLPAGALIPGTDLPGLPVLYHCDVPVGLILAT
jgi:hypothetical protein